VVPVDRPETGDVDLPRHLGVVTRRRAGRLEQPEPPAAALVAQTAGSLLDRFEGRSVVLTTACAERVASPSEGGGR
jgi:hypothetical protein